MGVRSSGNKALTLGPVHVRRSRGAKRFVWPQVFSEAQLPALIETGTSSPAEDPTHSHTNHLHALAPQWTSCRSVRLSNQGHSIPASATRDARRWNRYDIPPPFSLCASKVPIPLSVLSSLYLPAVAGTPQRAFAMAVSHRLEISLLDFRGGAREMLERFNENGMLSLKQRKAVSYIRAGEEKPHRGRPALFRNLSMEM